MEDRRRNRNGWKPRSEFEDDFMRTVHTIGIFALMFTLIILGVSSV